MQRLIGSVLFTLVASTLIAPSAHAVRPELLPSPQLNQAVERTQASQPQTKTTVMSMQTEKIQPAAKTEKSAYPLGLIRGREFYPLPSVLHP